jgi:tRNA threonylcarbamoyladenosine biosynthesis protein TsaB
MRDGVLALELSTSCGSVAVVGRGELLYEASFQAKRSHNAQVFGPLREALEAAGEGLRGIVVGTGPGSYTGVRIAIAAAQGVGLSRGVPVTGVTSLLGCGERGAFGVVGDARRGRFYVATMGVGALEPVIELVDPDGVRDLMERARLARWVTCDAVAPIEGVELVRPRATELARLAAEFPDEAWRTMLMEPLYLEGAFITQAKKRRVQDG